MKNHTSGDCKKELPYISQIGLADSIVTKKHKHFDNHPMFSLRKKELTIVIADDQELIRYLLAFYLIDFCAEILIAKNGEEVVEILKIAEGRQVILLTDLMMPVMSGFELIRLLKQEKEKYAHVKTIVISSQPYAEISGEILEKIDKFLDKTVSKDYLLEAICGLLGMGTAA